jgi:hypothetical protein
MPRSGREQGGEIRLAVRSRLSGLEEEALHTRRAEEHDATADPIPNVATGVNSALGDMDCLASEQPGACPLQLHLELAFDDVNRLGLIGVPVRRQSPTRRRVVDEQAERAGGVLAGQVDLGANATGHPHDARGVCHGPTIPVRGPARTTAWGSAGIAPSAAGA